MSDSLIENNGLASLKDVGFSTCCYMTKARGLRNTIVVDALNSWVDLLACDFGIRCFIDDLSPSDNGLRVLERSKACTLFDQVERVPEPHPPHSNFGIAYSFEIIDKPYILHLDDDVRVSGSTEELTEFISAAMNFLAEDPSLLGVNLLTLDKPDGSQMAWMPSTPYSRDETGGYWHPKKFLGTCACLIKKELTERMTFADVMSRGRAQEAHWEKIVSRDPKEFLVSKFPTPLSVDLRAWDATATEPSGIPKRIRRHVKNAIRRVCGRI